MKNIGITGMAGFIGSHLANYLGTFPEKYKVLSFNDDYFDNPGQLIEFVSKADIIVHLAGVNRHENENFVFSRNIELAELLIDALNKTSNRPGLIFSSSTQESRDNVYGQGKKKARILLQDWAGKNDEAFAGLIIPNVFGPFGKPFYNSAIATFCHQLTNGKEPEIKVDAELELIYIADLVKFVRQIIDTETSDPSLFVPPTGKMRVSEVLNLLQVYRKGYLQDHIIPDFTHPLETALFNTLRSFREITSNAAPLVLNKDDRGYLVEVVKEGCGGQSYFSFTKPGITRGNHFHTRKIERFCVVRGEAVIRLRKLGAEDVIEFPVSGNTPIALDIPVFYTHNITNTGKAELLTLFWSNEIFNSEDPDTYYLEV